MLRLIGDISLDEQLAKNWMRTALRDTVEHLNEAIELFKQFKNYQSQRATKDNCYGDALPVTNLLVAKLEHAAALLKDVSDITSASGVMVDPEDRVIYLLTN